MGERVGSFVAYGALFYQHTTIFVVGIFHRLVVERFFDEAKFLHPGGSVGVIDGAQANLFRFDAPQIPFHPKFQGKLLLRLPPASLWAYEVFDSYSI